MSENILLVVLASLSVVVQGVKESYFRLPLPELKRRMGQANSKHDSNYGVIFRVARYGKLGSFALNFFIWFFYISFVAILSQNTGYLLLILISATVAALILLVDNLKISTFLAVAVWVGPYLEKIIKLISSFEALIKKISKKRRQQKTEIYEIEDLIDFLNVQKRALNNRIPDHVINNLILNIESDKKIIKDYMIKKSNIHFVNPKDSIGPILLSELHRTGHKCFPVKGNSENHIEGVLHLDDATGFAEGGKVSQAMSQKIYYVHQNSRLEEVLRAYVKTHSHIYIVVNSQAEITGLISVKDALRQVIGDDIDTDFEEYNQKDSVAAAKK